MNILLLDTEELGKPLRPGDRRFSHIEKVLKKKPGDLLDAGCGDTLGLAKVLKIDEEGIYLEYTPDRKAAPLRPVELLAGFPRPIQAGRILKELTSLGVRAVRFCLTELGEKSYAESEFFKSGDYADFLRQGAEQAGNPLLPQVSTFWSLERALAELGERSGSMSRIALHPGGGLPKIGEIQNLGDGVILAVGSERGWTDKEVSTLRGAGFEVCSLGDRILKTETAAAVGVSIVLSRLGYL